MNTHTATTGSTGFGWVRSLVAFRHSNPVGRMVSSLVAFAIAALLVVGTGVPAQAASPCPIPGNFEIDGDMTQLTCTPSGDDWNTPGIGVQSTTQGGTYSTAGKDDGNPSTWVSSGSTPDKTNFERAYATSRVIGGHFYVFVGWERTSTSGTQGYAIEIDNSGANVGGDGTPQPNRGSGGAVFYISSQGSAAPTFDSACSFTSQSNYGTTCTSSNASVTSAINTGSISDPLAGTTQPAGSFFEVALDVTALTGIVPSCPGASAASVYLRSITGQTHNGNLKGYMAPLTVAPNSTCVAPPIDTTATPGGALNAPGSTQHDAVTVGTAQAPGVGSVKFYLCPPAVVTANGGDCSANGTLVSTNTLDANGQANSGNVTGATTPSDNALGKYCWRAEFIPGANDHHYLAGTHTNSSTECFTIVHGSPTIATQIAVTGDNAPGLGFTTLGDTAQLSGYVGSVSGETVTFKLYGPYAAGVTPTCAGDPVHTTTGSLNASGQATTSATYEPTQAGTYVWVASYPGDTLNDPIAGQCSDANESATIVGAQVDVAKSANPPGPVNAGSTIGFDITVTNDGAVPAKGVHVTDNLPAGADGVNGGDLDWSISPAYTGCQITGVAGSEVLDCTFTQVDGPGSLPVIHVSSATTPADCGTVKNRASISTTNGTGGDSDVATVVVRCADVTLTKTADHATVDAGQQIGFSVTASNSDAAGTGDATGVVIDDPLPSGAGIDWSIASGPANCSITGAVGSQTLHCTAVDLGPGASESVHVVSATTFSSCKVYDNTASLTATNHPSLSAGASTIVHCPDVSLTKTADDASVDAGQQIGFTITASNSSAAGTGNATAVVIDDPLPAGSGVDWSMVSGPANCSVTGAVGSQTLHCTAVTLAPGASEAIHVVSATSFASCKVYDNTASLTATNHPSLSADASTIVRCPDVSLTKTADHATVNAGEQIGFTVTAANNGAAGTGTAKGVVVDDPLPSGTGVDWSISSGPANCSILVDSGTGDQTLHCTATDLAPGASESVHVVSATGFASCAAYPNTASLTATNHPSLEASATTTVLCPGVNVTKTADHVSVDAGEQIGFVVTAANSDSAGSGVATGVVIDDPLPGGDGVDWSIASGPANCTIQGSAPSQTLHCTAVDLAPGASETIHVVSATSFESCKAYANTASLTATNSPSLTADASTTVLCPDVTLVKTADHASVDAGAQIGFTIAASNSNAAGTGTATGVVVEDLLPAGSGVNWSIASGPASCTIDGSPASQTLHCTAVDLAPGASESVHVVSATSFVSCAAYQNTASLTATNHPSLEASATTTVLCPDVTLAKTADDASVSAGEQIGFTVTAANSDVDGTGNASGVVVDDPLPAGEGVDWSIASGPENCTVEGSAPSQTLHCSAVDLAPGASESVHVVSGTSFASCAAYPNTASLTATNHPSLEASATATVLCPAVTLVKTADAASVAAGGQIGFTISASNSDAEGTGTAAAVVIDDPLPGGAGVSWSIATGPETCAIQGTAPSQTLHCDAVDLAPGASESVHVVSRTTVASCRAYPNTASLTATNHPSLTDGATTTVTGCVVVSPPPPEVIPPSLPNTGGPDLWYLAAGLVLVLGGSLLVLGDQRRRRRS
jgi:uncharacterized repeat protein (TIGR01451 family)/LPXTG-motif cell wall-anchored protein